MNNLKSKKSFWNKGLGHLRFRHDFDSQASQAFLRLRRADQATDLSTGRILP